MFLHLMVIFAAALSTVNCNCGPCETTPKHYEELGCVGKHIDGPCCPDERFECPDLTTLDSSLCHLKGKTYKIGENVTDESSPICHEGCICGEVSEGVAQFNCPILECLFPPNNDCVRQYSLHECCSEKRICGEEAKRLPKCHFNGKTYTHGEKFKPESNYFACYDCICDEKFENSTNIDVNKNCKKIDCGMELHHLNLFKRGCVPIYLKDSKCCPIAFRCPNENDKVLPIEGLPDINSVKENALCKFGNLTLQRRQGIETNDKCLDCICKQPPMVECIRRENCN